MLVGIINLESMGRSKQWNAETRKKKVCGGKSTSRLNPESDQERKFTT